MVFCVDVFVEGGTEMSESMYPFSAILFNSTLIKLFKYLPIRL